MSYNFKKSYYFWLFFLFLACEKNFIEDDLLPEVPREDMVFKVKESTVIDNQLIWFEIDTEADHTFLIFDTDSNSTIAKQTISPTIGINNFILYTKALPTKKLQLQLILGGEIIKSTFIIVE
jgi:hypothetical protein